MTKTYSSRDISSAVSKFQPNWKLTQEDIDWLQAFVNAAQADLDLFLKFYVTAPADREAIERLINATKQSPENVFNLPS